MLSILIPTFNNYKYLKLCLNSLKKNSNFEHEIIIHINDGSDGSLNLIRENKYIYTHTKENVGLCSAVNRIAKLATKKYIVYAHDDMYFCPGWDEHLLNEIKNYENDLFYISGSMIEPKLGHIKFDCGNTVESFNEKKLLENLKYLDLDDHQGTHFAPHLISKKMWNMVGGFSEEFNPGYGSDPDLNIKLWNAGVRIFKGLSKFKVYHFGSITLKKKENFFRNKGNNIFLKKWGFTTKFFKKHYLKTNTKFYGPLSEPNKNVFFYFDLLICKFKYFFLNLKKSL